ncbi:NUDIX domain-containing protein [Candidatus Woesearchaeota archaeon]|nr:NUDIX domain-containing protein [Candidatus Woesearchaeota archaeon]
MEISVVIVQNDKNELYVHQRKENKKAYPNLYGLGAGGKVNDGELPLEAARRELQEELGIDAMVKKLFSFPFSDPPLSYIINVYSTKYSSEIKSCNREFKWSGWMTLAQVDELSEENKLCPDTAIFYPEFKRRFLK